MALPNLKDSFISDAYYGYLHTNNVPVSGNNLPWVYDGRGNRSALKVGDGGVSVTGCLSAECISLPGFTSLVDFIFPVGSVFISADEVNPQDRFPNTTWVRISQGKFLAGVGEGEDRNSNTYTVLSGEAEVAGEYTHTLTVEELAEHDHEIRTLNVSTNDDNAGTSGYLGSSFRGLAYSGALQSERSLQVLNTGESEAHNNIPPYIGLFIWKRLT